MNIRAVILCCQLLFALSLWARESTDVIVMKNGDRFTGEIKALDSGVLYVSLPYVIQTLSVDWAKVAQLESKQVFLVKTEDGSVYRGVIASARGAAGRPIKIEVETPQNNPVILDSARVVNVAATSDKVLERFNGGLRVGSIYSKANQTAQYSLSGLAAYPREHWSAQASISSNLSAASGTTTSTRNQLTFEGIHTLPRKNYFYGGFDGFLQSTEQSITGQNFLGAGVGRYLMNTNRCAIAVLGGATWLRTQYSPTVSPIETQNGATAMIFTAVKLYTFNKTGFDLNAVLLPGLSQPGRVYFSTNASYNIKIIHNLSWNIAFYANWDNQPPSHLPGSDYGSSAGLSWTFGTSLRTTPTTFQ